MIFEFCIKKKSLDLAHKKLMNIIGLGVEINIDGCQPNLEMTIYALKSACSGLLGVVHHVYKTRKVGGPKMSTFCQRL